MDERRVFILKSDGAAFIRIHPFIQGIISRNLILDEIDKENRIYGLVRETLCGLGMDRDNFGTADWNPFGETCKTRR